MVLSVIFWMPIYDEVKLNAIIENINSLTSWNDLFYDENI